MDTDSERTKKQIGDRLYAYSVVLTIMACVLLGSAWSKEIVSLIESLTQAFSS